MVNVVNTTIIRIIILNHGYKRQNDYCYYFVILIIQPKFKRHSRKVISHKTGGDNMDKDKSMYLFILYESHNMVSGCPSLVTLTKQKTIL